MIQAYLYLKKSLKNQQLEKSYKNEVYAYFDLKILISFSAIDNCFQVLYKMPQKIIKVYHHNPFSVNKSPPAIFLGLKNFAKILFLFSG